ncbi:polysaccharide biosynthesis tyrosine autokinase [Actinoplanes subglobosus]|uniref:Polysaccharide biosynthesis tyrosine autokinase n=1 Tax=Actinoplanes subglobosus TaxID=1547892 RepID=A0ABV8J3F1_9ACTN
MTTYGRTARLLRRYGPWVLVVTTAAVGTAWGLHRSAPAGYESEATVLVGTGRDLEDERQVVLSDLVALPAAGRVAQDTTTFLDGLTVEAVPGANVLRFVYTAENPLSARVRARALVESYAAYRVETSVLSEPNLPAAPAARPLLPYLGAGAAAGLLLGTVTAFLRARTRGTIRSREDYARLAGAPVLATVPRVRRSRGADAPIALREPASPAAEAYRYLRSRLLPSLRDTGATTILVTSPGDRQGRTTTAANLAVTLARTGRKVVLVDADLRNPQLHRVFQAPGDRGLTMLLDGDAAAGDVLEDTGVRNLRLLPAGHRRLVPGGGHVDLLDSDRIATVLRSVRDHADVVVLDSPAVLTAADAIALAAVSDQVLLVGDFARTGRETVRRALAELAEVVRGNIRPVLVNVPRSAGALIPHTRPVTANQPLTRDRLQSDADDVAPPGVTSHAYVPIEDTQAYLFTDSRTVAVPIINGTAPERVSPVGSTTTPAVLSD